MIVIKALLVSMFSVLLLAGYTQNKTAQSAIGKPNVIYILADDMGYGELGCYGQQKIKTPNIDRLASQGMKFTQHYVGTPVCAPSRCNLLTGRNSGHAYIRGNIGLPGYKENVHEPGLTRYSGAYFRMWLCNFRVTLPVALPCGN